MDDQLACYGCGLIFDSADAQFDMGDDDPAASCPECGSNDVVTVETYLGDCG